MYLTWIASVDKKVEESIKLGVVVSGKLLNLSVFAPLPCTVYLVYIASFGDLPLEFDF